MTVVELGKQGVRLDLTVNLGQIITAVTMFVAVVSAYWALQSDIRLNQTRIHSNHQAVARQTSKMDQVVTALNAIKTDIAVIRYRLNGDGKDAIQSSR